VKGPCTYEVRGPFGSIGKLVTIPICTARCVDLVCASPAGPLELPRRRETDTEMVPRCEPSTWSDAVGWRAFRSVSLGFASALACLSVRPACCGSPFLICL